MVHIILQAKNVVLDRALTILKKQRTLTQLQHMFLVPNWMLL